MQKCTKCNAEIEHLDVSRTTSAKVILDNDLCVFEDEEIDEEYYSCPECKAILMSMYDRDSDGRYPTISIAERVQNFMRHGTI